MHRSDAITAIFFDAGGTLIHPDPAPGVVYAGIGRQFNSQIDAVVANDRFRKAFSRRNGLAILTTSETAEDVFWRAVVAEVLDDVSDFEECYRALWNHFARPEAWRVDPAAGPVLSALAERGFHLGVCSNFDLRLRTILSGKPELAPLRTIVISSEVGWRKPASEFFQSVVALAGVPAVQVLVIGDDRDNDFEGARAAGLSALLLDPKGGGRAGECIGSLRDLLKL